MPHRQSIWQFYRRCFTAAAVLLWIPLTALAGDVAHPVVAIFLLGGDAPADVREQAGFSLRMKLKRDGHYSVIDGPTMEDAASGVAVDAGTDVTAVRKLAAELSPAVIVWGEVDAGAAGPKLVLNLLDLRAPGAAPRRFERVLAQPTDLRFAVEDALRLLPGVGPFERVSEQAFSDDPASAARFARNPNLLSDGNFSSGARWRVLLRREMYAPMVSVMLPGKDAARIVPTPAGFGEAGAADGARPAAAEPRAGATGAGARVLAMRLSNGVAQNNGLACLSPPATVVAGMRYRLAFRYWSDGPFQHVLVKGYSGPPGGPDEREVYRRQVPPSGPTGGKWQTVVCDLTPQSQGPAVQRVRVDLYAYVAPGLIEFGDVQLKAIGDAAAQPATTEP